MKATIYPGQPAEASLEVVSTTKLIDGRVVATCKSPEWKTYFPIMVGTLKDGILTETSDCRDHAEAIRTVQRKKDRAVVSRAERSVTRAIAKAALANGLNLTINGVMCYKVSRLSIVMDAIQGLDEVRIVLCRGDKKVGVIHLVYGNSGWDTICDFSSNPEIEEIVAAGEAVQEKFASTVRNRNWA